MILKRPASLLAATLVLACAAMAATPVYQENGHVELASVDELILMQAKKKPVTVIDVRNLDTYDMKIKGALQIPLDDIESRLKEVPRNAEIITYCA